MRRRSDAGGEERICPGTSSTISRAHAIAADVRDRPIDPKDILRTAYHLLGVDAVHCSALPLGGGFVAGAHGRMPVPGPGTAELLKGFPVVDTGVKRELVTPTGAAILTTLATFGIILLLAREGFESEEIEDLTRSRSEMESKLRALEAENAERRRDLQIASKGDWTSPISIRFTVDPIKVKGQTLQLRRTIAVISAYSFTVTEELSEDGGPFVRLGQAIFSKE